MLLRQLARRILSPAPAHDLLRAGTATLRLDGPAPDMSGPGMPCPTSFDPLRSSSATTGTVTQRPVTPGPAAFCPVLACGLSGPVASGPAGQSRALRARRRCRLPALFAATAFLPVTLAAAGLDLTAAEHAAFRAEVRAILLAEPEIVARSLSRDLNQDLTDEIAGDKALLKRHAAAIFSDPADRRLGSGASDDSPASIAAFLDPASPDMQTARGALEAFARAQPDLVIAVKEVIPGSAAAALADTLGLDLLPSYVLPDRLIRGDVPPAMLLRHLPDTGD